MVSCLPTSCSLIAVTSLVVSCLLTSCSLVTVTYFMVNHLPTSGSLITTTLLSLHPRARGLAALSLLLALWSAACSQVVPCSLSPHPRAGELAALRKAQAAAVQRSRSLEAQLQAAQQQLAAAAAGAAAAGGAATGGAPTTPSSATSGAGGVFATPRSATKNDLASSASGAGGGTGPGLGLGSGGSLEEVSELRQQLQRMAATATEARLADSRAAEAERRRLRNEYESRMAAQQHALLAAKAADVAALSQRHAREMVGD